MNSRTPLFLLVIICLGTACPDGRESTSTDAGTSTHANSCSSRADCESLGAHGVGLVCASSGRCEPCASDGQCRLKERCDLDTARCTFKEGYGDDCTFNDECLAGEFCVQGLCRPALDVTLCTDGRCLASSQRCNVLNGICEIDLGCLEDADCTEGELCNLPTRECVTRCTEGNAQYLCLPGEKCLGDRCSACAGDSDCSAGMTCDLDALSCILDDGGVVRCSSDRECDSGWICDPDLAVCVEQKPACTSDESCASTERCHIASGKCLPRDCEPDRFEPNDTFEAALASERVLVEGTFSDLTLCGADIDFYAFELARGDNLSASLDVDVLLDGQLSIAIIDPLERTLGLGSLAASGVAVMDGRHAVRIASNGITGAWVDYGLILALSEGMPCDFDIFEPNNTIETATHIEAPGTMSGLTICGNDVDFFKITAPKGTDVRVEATVTQGSAAIDVEELDETRGTMNDVAAQSETSSRLFKISSPFQRVALTYTLKIHFDPVDPD